MNIAKNTKIIRIVRIAVLPAVALAAVVYAFFSPPRFPLGDEYLFCSVDREQGVSVILEPGGRQVVGPAVIRLWGAAPWVFGTTESGAFLLNMKEHECRVLDPADPEFRDFLKEHGFSLSDTVTWSELYSGPKERRLLLKNRLSSKRGTR